LWLKTVVHGEYTAKVKDKGKHKETYIQPKSQNKKEYRSQQLFSSGAVLRLDAGSLQGPSDTGLLDSR
jgi:hypothetical protein